MGFFDFLKNEEVVKEAELVLNFNELKLKINDELSNLNRVDEKHISIINSRLNELRQSIKSLAASEVKEEVSKALLIGVNNSRRVLCNTIESSIKVLNPETLTGFNDYLGGINKLINGAHNSFGRHGGKVSFIYKKEMSELTTTLDNLRYELNDCLKGIEVDLSRVNSLKVITKLINDYESLIIESRDLKKSLSISNESLDKLKNSEDELRSELSKLLSSTELRDAKRNEDKINKLKSELSLLKRGADIIVSDFSKALKRFSHDSSNNVINSLLTEPLKTITDYMDDFLKLKDVLLRELESGSIPLKHKQLVKAKNALSSDELLKLSNDYLRINNELNALKGNSKVINDESGLKGDINKLVEQIKSFDREIYELKADINSINDKLKDLLEKLAGKSSEVLDTNVVIMK